MPARIAVLRRVPLVPLTRRFDPSTRSTLPGSPPTTTSIVDLLIACCAASMPQSRAEKVVGTAAVVKHGDDRREDRGDDRGDRREDRRDDRGLFR